MKNRWDNNNTRDLMQAIVRLRTEGEAKRFFRDLLTEEELVEFGKRWLAARLLSRGVSYTKINNRTRLGSKTIARVSFWLNRAGMNGYKLMLNKIDSVRRRSSSGLSAIKFQGGQHHHAHLKPVRKGVAL